MVRFKVIRASQIVTLAFLFLFAVAIMGFVVRVLPALSSGPETVPEPVSAPVAVDHMLSMEEGRQPALFSPEESNKPSRASELDRGGAIGEWSVAPSPSPADVASATATRDAQASGGTSVDVGDGVMLTTHAGGTDVAGDGTDEADADPAPQATEDAVAASATGGGFEVSLVIEEHEEQDATDESAQREAEEIRIELDTGDNDGNDARNATGEPVVPGASGRVLLYHTHSQEAYAQIDGDLYKEAGKWHTADTTHNIMRVGDELTNQLTAQGFAVTHDTTDHEPPNHQTAYTRSLATLESYRERGDAFDLYIDLHRDAYSESQKQLTVQDDRGRDCARLMMLIGSGEAGFTVKPNWKENYKLAQRITDELNALCPGICRTVMVKTGRYNQHISTNSVLIEVGNNRNTLEQAENAMEILAEALKNVMK